MKNLLIIFICILLPICSACYKGENPGENAAVEMPEDEPEYAPPPGIISLSILPGKLTPEFNKNITEYILVIESSVAEIELCIEPAPGSSVQTVCGDIYAAGNVSVIPLNSIAAVLFLSANNDKGAEMLYSIQINRMIEKDTANASFEQFDPLFKPDSWTLSGPGNFISTDAASLSGNCSAYFSSLTTSIGGREVLSSPVQIEGGTGLIVSAWILLPASESGTADSVSAGLKLYYYKDQSCETPASTAQATMPKISPEEQGAWERVRWERIADQVPDDARFVRITLRACYNKETGGTKNHRLYFDCISLQQ